MLICKPWGVIEMKEDKTLAYYEPIENEVIEIVLTFRSIKHDDIE